MAKMWFKVGDIAHLTKNITMFGKRFKFKDEVKILEVYPKQKAYLCEIPVRWGVHQVELCQSSLISPKMWDLTCEQDRKIKELLKGSQ